MRTSEDGEYVISVVGLHLQLESEFINTCIYDTVCRVYACIYPDNISLHDFSFDIGNVNRGYCWQKIEFE